MAAIVVFVKFVLAGHKVTTQWGHNVTVLPGVTVVDFHSDVVIPPIVISQNCLFVTM